jgi:hypothetical protein
MKSHTRSLLLAMMASLTFLTQSAVALTSTETAATIVRQSQHASGFFDLYYDGAQGELYLASSRLNQPFLLLTSLPQGVGSNDIGLDRGQLGRTRMVQFERQGPYLLLKQLNTQYRALTDNAAERRAVTEAFAESVLWRGKVVEGEPALVSINALVLNDLHGVTDVLAQTGQGNYRLDATRSLILPKGVKSFEKNTDVDVLLTFNAEVAGPQVAEVTPDGKALSVRMRYSFIALPEPGFVPRGYHPMSGFLSDDYLDFAVPVDSSVRRRHLLRHRLQKRTPGNAPSEVIKPIVYYLDPGVPEPIRSALLDGARWWEKAFTQAGFIKAFRVELLPEDADPQDIRYNMIQWVHRASRGWSFGAAVADPRTGEIIKGHVTLGSLRVRQDHLIARGLTAGWSDAKEADEAVMALSLARIRQLAAHEVGHTLGLDHNFAASSNNNASVMDYPHPRVGLKGEQIDISGPYEVGVGAWDNFAIAFGYGEYGDDATLKAAQAKLLANAARQGLRYIGEADAREPDASHAYASLWDNGGDPVAELIRLNEVRSKAIGEFSALALLPDEPWGELSDAFVPIYLLTRYQITAAAKLIGGADYSYQQDEVSKRWHYVAPSVQFSALDVLLQGLSPSALTVPQTLTDTLVPKSGNYQRSRESFDSGLGVVTDPLGMAEVLARHTTQRLLAPRRLNRVNQGYLSDREQLSVTTLIDKLLAATLYSDNHSGLEIGVWMRVNAVTLDSLLASLHHADTAPEVKALIDERLHYTVQQLARRQSRVDAYQAAHFNWLAKGIEAALTDADARLLPKPLPMPPGSPI